MIHNGTCSDKNCVHVYEIICWCGAGYIGETIRPLKIRLAGQKPIEKKNLIELLTLLTGN